jgi:putative endopeptidase
MKIANLLLGGFALGAVGLASCQQKNDGTTVGKSDFKFIDRANMDTTVKPADNFFQYANGGWLKTAKIPGDQTSWGSFEELAEKSQNDLHALLEDAMKNTNAPAGSKERMAGDFYKSGMDTAAIEKAGITPLKPVLDRINAVSNPQQLIDEMALEQTEGFGGAFGFNVSPDDKDVTKEICQFYQGGLGLSTKDDYFAKDARSVAIRAEYLKYVQSILQLMGQDVTAAASNAQKIFALETSFASASLAPVEMRDPQKLYNKFNIAGIDKLTPGLEWKNLLEKLKANGQDSIIVATPKFFVNFSKQLTAMPIDVWKLYLSYNFASDMSPYLSKAFADTRFGFYGKFLTGQEVQRARWKRVAGVVGNNIGEQLGQLYVDKHFKPEAKKRMLELVNNLQAAFSEHINALDWMSDVTKQKALAKLNAFVKKIGYPDKWKDYSSLKIVPDNYVQNVLNSSVFEYNYTMNKLGKPVDRTEWGMTPQTVNAYYNPGFNEIVFPAAILQFPFFDFDADDAVNYGGIGAVIGHEMTHGFDDQGAQYAADGNLKDWWTADDKTKFKQRTEQVVKQFDGYTVLDSIHVNGSLTQGENIADLGGITIAYAAFKKTKEGKSEDKIDGFTPDQRFFLSWAQVWRGLSKAQSLQERIKADPHSPEQWRVNGPLSNFEPFYKAFGVKAGDKMWRADSIRAKIW